MKSVQIATNNPKFLELSKDFIEFAELFQKENNIWIEARISLPIEGKKNKRKVIVIRINEE